MTVIVCVSTKRDEHELDKLRRVPSQTQSQSGLARLSRLPHENHSETARFPVYSSIEYFSPTSTCALFHTLHFSCLLPSTCAVFL